MLGGVAGCGLVAKATITDCFELAVEATTTVHPKLAAEAKKSPFGDLVRSLRACFCSKRVGSCISDAMHKEHNDYISAIFKVKAANERSKIWQVQNSNERQ